MTPFWLFVAQVTLHEIVQLQRLLGPGAGNTRLDKVRASHLPRERECV